MKRINIIITVFIHFHSNTRFLHINIGLSQNNLKSIKFSHVYITFIYALSATSLKHRLYILMDIRYYTYNPLNVRHILTVYHTHVTNMSIRLNRSSYSWNEHDYRSKMFNHTKNLLQLDTHYLIKAQSWIKWSNKGIKSLHIEHEKGFRVNLAIYCL